MKKKTPDKVTYIYHNEFKAIKIFVVIRSLGKKYYRVESADISLVQIQIEIWKAKA